MTSLRLQLRDLRELHQWFINECVYLPVAEIPLISWTHSSISGGKHELIFCQMFGITCSCLIMSRCLAAFVMTSTPEIHDLPCYQ
jgi:uncharacterized membrane protein YhdT